MEMPKYDFNGLKKKQQSIYSSFCTRNPKSSDTTQFKKEMKLILEQLREQQMSKATTMRVYDKSQLPRLIVNYANLPSVSAALEGSQIASPKKSKSFVS